MLVPLPRHRPSTAGGPKSTGLPPDLLRQAAGRLRVMALLYAGVFFMAGFFPQLLFPSERVLLFSDAYQWLPGGLAISLGVVVAFLARPGTKFPALQVISVVFEIASSYGIAAAEFFHPP